MSASRESLRQLSRAASSSGGGRPVPAPALEGTLSESVRQSPFSTVVYDPHGHPLLLNPAFERMWGVSSDSVPPGYSVLTDPELERQGVLPVIRRAFQGEAVVTPPVRYDISAVSSTGTGRTLWTEGHFYPINDPAGRLLYVVLCHVDLTERKQVEAVLQQQEERLRLAQRAARIGTFDWHIPTGQVAWTEEEERIFGLEPGTFRGTIRAWRKFVLPDDQQCMREELTAAMERRDPEMEFGFRIRRPDGEVRWIEGSAQFLYDAQGRPLRMVGVNFDVTDRLRAEQQRRRNAELLEETERIAQMGSWEWDLRTGTLTWSAEMYRVYGLDPASAPVGFERFSESIHPADREMVQGVVERALATGGSFAFDHRILRGDGQVRYLHGRGRVEMDAQGRPVRVVGSGQDITERKQTEEALSRAKEEAEAASQAKSDFLAVMSHELRTPLNAIAGYAELIELGIRGPVTEAQREDLRRIQESQRHLLGLINEVLNYARVEAGAVSFQIERVCLGELVAAATTLVLPQVHARGQRLTVAPSAPELDALVDAERLKQILLNLLSNAIKFTQPGGSIEVATRVSGEWAAVQVRDTGIGIPRDSLQSIFEPFVQVGRALSRPADGVGLGLAISRDLARGMGGDLFADSTLGVGSTFTLLLPRPQ